MTHSLALFPLEPGRELEEVEGLVEDEVEVELPRDGFELLAGVESFDELEIYRLLSIDTLFTAAALDRILDKMEALTCAPSCRLSMIVNYKGQAFCQ